MTATARTRAYPDTMLVLAALLAAVTIPISAALRGAMLKDPPARLAVRNYRGRDIPSVGGIVILGTFLAGEALLTLIALLKPIGLEGADIRFSAAAIPRTFLSNEHSALLILVLGFFLLGAVDDLAGAGQAKGFRGHLGALRRGVVTGGALKAFGGLALGLVVGGILELSLLPALVDALVIALTANLLNLLDLRPGRASKVFLTLWVPLAAAGLATPFLPVTVMVAAACAIWLSADLGERGMLGDSGSNLLGAVLGGGLVILLDVPARAGILALLVVLTLLSEVRSFTAIIEGNRALRWFDDLGGMTEKED